MAKEFARKVVVVSGGTGDLGGAVLSMFVKGGATVVVPFISEMNLNTLLTDHPEFSEKVRFERTDLTNVPKVKQFVDGVLKKEKGIDMLVNLAGGYLGNATVLDSKPSQYASMFDLNFRTVYNLTKQVLPAMLEKKRGKIVTIGAQAGRGGTAGLSAYSIGKAAVMRFTEALADEVKREGINVNCILPSIIDTPNNRREMPGADHDEWVDPEDIADVIHFLVSEQARALHGACIPVYGLG